MGTSIQIISANQRVARQLQQALAGAGYQAETFAAGAEGGDQLPAGPAGLVLLHIEDLSDEAGGALARRRLPTIVLLGAPSPGAVSAALDLGAEDALIMPVSVPELVARIRAILRRRPG